MFTALLATLRLPFLSLTFVCVALGTALAWSLAAQFSWPLFGLTLSGALLAHISVNTLNEYVDFVSGLDLLTTKTPFSGGSGGLLQYPQLKHTVLLVGIVSLLGVALLGGYFLMLRGWQLLPIGVLGMLLVVSYSPWINRSPWLCLIAPGLGFGPLMVLGSFVVQAGTIHPAAIWLSFLPFFLVNNLLLLNQYPDREADAQVGRKNFVIVYGIAVSNGVYVAFACLAVLVLLLSIIVNLVSVWALIALLPLALSFYVWRCAMQVGENLAAHSRVLALNVVIALLTPLCVVVVLALTSSTF